MKQEQVSSIEEYFKKLEKEANRLGVNLDDLIAEFNHSSYAKPADKEDASKASKRKEVFKKEQGRKNKDAKAPGYR